MRRRIIDGVWVDNVQLHVLGNCGHCVQLECQRDFERFVIDLDGLN
jgi:pimeloyl-ACP methyl ester carboxylesterase